MAPVAHAKVTTMQNAELTQHLILLEERMRAIEAALVRVESPSALSLVAKRLTSIDQKLALLVPPDDVRAAMDAATEHQDAAADAAPLQARQLAELTAWIENRMSGDPTRMEFADLAFISQQLVSVMQGTRADVVQMRATLLRLAHAVEVAIGQMPNAREVALLVSHAPDDSG
jgi:hypothetical protein